MATNQSIPQPQEIVTMAAVSLDKDPLVLATRQEIVTMAAASLDNDPLVLATRHHASAMAGPSSISLKYYHQLYLAALKGDWEAAKVYFKDNIPDVYTESICISGKNALLVASCNGHTKFVEKLVERMSDEALSRCDRAGYSALHYAAIGGHLKMAKALIRKNPHLTQLITPNNSKYTPLLCAVLFFAKHKLVHYLATVTPIEVPERPFTACNTGELMVNLTHMGYHDISLYLIRRHPSLALAESLKGETILQVLAYEPGHFCSGTKLQFWERWIYKLHDEDDSAHENQSLTDEAKLAQVYRRIKNKLWGAIKKLVPCINNVREKKLGHKRACKLVDACLQALLINDVKAKEHFRERKILDSAASCGVVEVVTASLNYFPDLVFTKQGSLLLRNGIQWRQVEIFNLACKSTALDKMLAAVCYEPSILYLAAELPKNTQLSDHSNAALQMQREFQWFKAIESIVHPSIRQLRLKEGKTAFDLFSENRKEMRQNSETWMKNTSNSTMIVATLITTVAFAGVFTIPGGTNENGLPNFLTYTSFNVFMYSDAIALISSVTSVLMFLSILTSNYRERDFGRALPKRMIIGLASLFLALASIIAAFGAGLELLLRQRFRWAWGPIMVLASIPVTLFIMLQLPLLFAMVESTYGTIFRPEKIWKID